MQSTSELHVVVGIGPVGRAVIDELVSRGYRVRAVARHGAPDLAPSVDFMPADVTDEGDSRRALAGATVVHHVASAPYHSLAGAPLDREARTRPPGLGADQEIEGSIPSSPANTTTCLVRRRAKRNIWCGRVIS
jgi:hypothetical protein